MIVITRGYHGPLISAEEGQDIRDLSIEGEKECGFISDYLSSHILTNMLLLKKFVSLYKIFV